MFTRILDLFIRIRSESWLSITAFRFLISFASTAAQGSSLRLLENCRTIESEICHLAFFLHISFYLCFDLLLRTATVLQHNACTRGLVGPAVRVSNWPECLESGCTLRCKTMVTGNWAESHLKYCHFAQTWDCLHTLLTTHCGGTPAVRVLACPVTRTSLSLFSVHFFFFFLRQQRQPNSRHTLAIHRLLWFI